AGGIGVVAYRDYSANQVKNDYALAIITIGSDISAAQRAADRKPPDNQLARQKGDHARLLLEEAARSTAANQTEVASLRDQIGTLDDLITGVIVDLARVTDPDGDPIAATARPPDIVATENRIDAAGPRSGPL